MKRYTYHNDQRKRGKATVLASIFSYIVFSFFLMAGFGEQNWAFYSFLVLTLFMLIMLLSGVGAMRAGMGTIELTSDGVSWQNKGRQIFLPYSTISLVSFGGLIYPKTVIGGEGKRIAVYKKLLDYPLFWQKLSEKVQTPALAITDLDVHCRKTEHMGVLLLVSVLMLIALAGTIMLYMKDYLLLASMLISITLFTVVLLICVLSFIFKLGVYRFKHDEIIHTTLFERHSYPIGLFKGISFEQAQIRQLAIGYRYRGPAMTNTVQFSRVGYGLRVCLQTSGEPVCLDETMTKFPLELLFDYIIRRYNLTVLSIENGTN